jgi:hypothetical protein
VLQQPTIGDEDDDVVHKAEQVPTATVVDPIVEYSLYIKKII